MKASERVHIRSERGARILLWLGILGTGAFYLVPYAWIFLTSIKSDSDLFETPPIIIPAHPVLRYAAVLFSPKLYFTLTNSVIVGTVTTLVTLALVIPASYALVRFRIKGRSTLLLLFLVLMLFPPISFLGYLFNLIKGMGLFDNVIGVILPYIALNIPLGIWVLTSFIKSVPVEMEEAAIVDGADRLDILRKIVFPLIGPGIAAAALIVFITSWNEFMIALTLTISRAETIPIGIYMFMGVYTMNWGDVATATILASLPVVVAAVIAQRLIVRGLTAGAVKG